MKRDLLPNREDTGCHGSYAERKQPGEMDACLEPERLREDRGPDSTSGANCERARDLGNVGQERDETLRHRASEHRFVPEGDFAPDAGSGAVARRGLSDDRGILALEQPLFACTIFGRPIVKKNTQRTVGYGKARRVIYSPQYLEWLDAAVLAIRCAKPQWPGNPINFPINLRCSFRFADKRSTPDLSNLYEGIQDVLETEGVITNDKFIAGHDGSRIVIDGHAMTEVTITRMPKQEQ